MANEKRKVKGDADFDLRHEKDRELLSVGVGKTKGGQLQTCPL